MHSDKNLVISFIEALTFAITPKTMNAQHTNTDVEQVNVSRKKYKLAQKEKKKPKVPIVRCDSAYCHRSNEQVRDPRCTSIFPPETQT